MVHGAFLPREKSGMKVKGSFGLVMLWILLVAKSLRGRNFVRIFFGLMFVGKRREYRYCTFFSYTLVQ